MTILAVAVVLAALASLITSVRVNGLERRIDDLERGDE